MRNVEKTISLSGKVIKLAEKLPYFTIDHLKTLGIQQEYLHRILSRYIAKKIVIRLKKGFYTTTAYLQHSKIIGEYSSFMEFLCSALYRQSYLTGEYILYQHNILTDVPVHFTAITTKKTKYFTNPLGTFIYHSIKPSLFIGFGAEKNGQFIIHKATLAKALFDFLYARKSTINNKKSFDALRLNLEALAEKEKKEFKLYAKEEGSKKMALITAFVCH